MRKAGVAHGFAPLEWSRYGVRELWSLAVSPLPALQYRLVWSLFNETNRIAHLELLYAILNGRHSEAVFIFSDVLNL